MQVNIIAFGQIKDITGNSEIVLNDVADTNQLVQKLHSVYPALVNTKYAIAVDRKIINSNTELNNNNTIALLPPFSGG
jgi:molybdopterin synthase sulfur carrier subunit